MPQAQSVAPRAGTIGKAGFNGVKPRAAARAKNPIRSMTNVENQAPANMWRMSVAPMMDWIDIQRKSLSDSNLEEHP
ncbi:hypothetical protein [Delftia acidovorans]|uniref:hypothetical protein n=1 Tax=Delftia acidovorans TaxID=80866 RepID=UPI00334123A5